MHLKKKSQGSAVSSGMFLWQNLPVVINEDFKKIELFLAEDWLVLVDNITLIGHIWVFTF